MWGTKKKRAGACANCGSELELLELNAQRGSKVLQCPACGFLHFYRKEFFGGWKFIKAERGKDMQERK